MVSWLEQERFKDPFFLPQLFPRQLSQTFIRSFCPHVTSCFHGQPWHVTDGQKAFLAETTACRWESFHGRYPYVCFPLLTTAFLDHLSYQASVPWGKKTTWVAAAFLKSLMLPAHFWHDFLARSARSLCLCFWSWTIWMHLVHLVTYLLLLKRSQTTCKRPPSFCHARS